MAKDSKRKFWIISFVFAGFWVGIKYLLPLVLPFLLGWILAELAEPGVKFLSKRIRCPRAAASAICVSACLVALVVILVLFSAAAYREAGALWRNIPGLTEELSDIMARVRNTAMDAVEQAPEGLSVPLERMIRNLFEGSNVVLDRAAGAALGVAGGIVSGIPGGALMIGTAVISAYMISAQLPVLKKRVTGTKCWQLRMEPVLHRIREAVSGWLKAQAKLLAVTFGIVYLGFLLLKIRNGFLWAFFVALVDAIPMLGTGTILIPWGLLFFLRSEPVRGVGFLAIYLVAMLVRSALEPRVVGKQMGINPLLTLAALYTGFRIWGVGGMILAPILTVTASQLVNLKE